MSTLFAKLQFKNSDKILLINAPDEFRPHLAEINASTRIDTTLLPNETYDFTVVFVKSCAEVQQSAAPVVNHLNDDIVHRPSSMVIPR